MSEEIVVKVKVRREAFYRNALIREPQPRKAARCSAFVFAFSA